jgi:hypothetical protein
MKPYFNRIFAVIYLLFSCVSQSLDAMKDASCDEKTIEQAQRLNYSINLMWINRDFDKDQRFIHPSKDEATLNKNFLDIVFAWARLHTDAVVNIWFDGAFISPEAIRNTSAALAQRLLRSKETPTATILLRDIRTLHKVIKYPNVFSNKIPVYFRVDLARMIIALELLSTSPKPTYFVYADLDMKPLIPEKLFDLDTMQKLKEYGFIMSAFDGPFANFENGFQIISNINHNLLKAISFVIVDLNIARALNALKGEFFDVRLAFDTKKHCPMKDLQEAVYKSYGIMFKYFLSLDKKETWKFQVIANEKFRDYDKKTDGLKPFGLRRATFPWPIHRVECRPIQSFWATMFEHFFIDKTDLLHRDYDPKHTNKYMPTTWVAELPPSEIGQYEDPLFDPSNKLYIAPVKDPYEHENPETW